MEHYHFRGPETFPGSDPSIGRRISWGDNHCNPKTVLLNGWKNDSAYHTACKGGHVGKRHLWLRKHMRSMAFMVILMGFVLLLDSLMMSIFDSRNVQYHSAQSKSGGLEVNIFRGNSRCPTLEVASDVSTGP